MEDDTINIPLPPPTSDNNGDNQEKKEAEDDGWLDLADSSSNDSSKSDGENSTRPGSVAGESLLKLLNTAY